MQWPRCASCCAACHCSWRAAGSRSACLRLGGGGDERGQDFLAAHLWAADLLLGNVICHAGQDASLAEAAQAALAPGQTTQWLLAVTSLLSERLESRDAAGKHLALVAAGTRAGCLPLGMVC